MKQLKKHILFIYVITAIAGLGLIIHTFILPSSDKLYQYVPSDCDVVIEINANNFIKEVGHQWVYEPEHFEADDPIFDEENLSENFKDMGINIFSKVLIFNEMWAEESLWFAVLEYHNEAKLTTYLEKNLSHSTVVYKNNIAIIQLSQSTNQTEVTTHIENILAKKVKSIEANPVIKTEFSNNHEINIYLKSLKSDYLTDGYLNINFNSTQIDISGYFHPIGSSDIKPIAYATEQNIGISLRSSLNLLNTIYLFNDTKLEYVPDYKQIAFDYDGVDLLTNNDVIPVTSYPNINLSLDINDEKVWLQYIDANIDDGSLLVSNDTIMINSEIKAKIRYEIANQKFSLFQKPKKLALVSNTNQTYFDLKIHPKQIIEKMYFTQDEKDPPKLVATQIIKIVKSILEDFTYIKAIDEIFFTIEKSDENENYISKGHLVYENKNSHSTIESYYLFQKLVQTFGSILR